MLTITKPIKSILKDTILNPSVVSGFSSITLYDYYKINAPQPPIDFIPNMEGIEYTLTNESIQKVCQWSHHYAVEMLNQRNSIFTN